MPYRLRRDLTVTWLLAVSPLPTGLIIALFHDRFTSASWRFAGGIPGGYPTWGGILIACGAVMITALIAQRHRTRHHENREAVLIAGMTVVGVWWFILGALFLYTSVVDPLANPLGVAAWWTIAAQYFAWAWYERRRL